MHTEKVTILEKSINELVKQAITLDAKIAGIANKCESHLLKERELQLTLTNIDNNVDTINLKLAEEPMKRRVAMDQAVDPLWKTVREIKQQVNIIPDIAEAKLKDTVKSHVIVIWAFITIIASMACYIAYEAEANLNKAISENTEWIKKQHDK